MAYVIGITGPGNCGKSSIMKDICMELKGIGLTVEQMEEIPRKVFDEIGNEDMLAFQEEITKQEGERASLMKNSKADVVLVDRCRWDGIGYSIFNMFHGKMNRLPDFEHLGNPYDLVIYFSEPFKNTTTANFEHYNDATLEHLLRGINVVAAGNIEKFDNAADYELIIESITENLERAGLIK